MIKRVRRISLFSGPGGGKSTLCAYVFSVLKIKGYNIEQVTEVIKPFVYEGRSKKGFDDVLFFAKQLHKEDVLLRNGVDYIVTDSPVLLQTFYSNLVGNKTVKGQLQMAKMFEEEYPSLNIFLARDFIKFSSTGRYEKTVEDAIVLDNKIIAFLKEHNISFDTLHGYYRDLLVEKIENRLTFWEKE